MIVQKWNFKTESYEPCNLPDDKKIVLYSDNMKLIVSCANCLKEITFGDGYTSREIHSLTGFGYPVCENCHEREYKEEINHG